MRINGKDIGLRYSVRARLQIAALCPDGRIEKLGEFLSDNDEKSVHGLAKVAQIMNSEYERFKRKERQEPIEDDANYAVFDMAEVEDMTVGELNELDAACMEAMQRDSARTVETEPPKGKAGKKTVNQR